MLDVAKKYEAEIQQKYYDTWFDLKYQYYRDSIGDRIPQFGDNCYERRDFACIDPKDNHVIGYISYSFSESSSSAYNFGIISFEPSNPIFGRDVLQVMSDIFFKFHLNRVEFRFYSDNPASIGYRYFIKRFGGREVGYLTNVSRLADNELHNVTIFEILRSNLKWRWFDHAVITPELAYRTGRGEQESVLVGTPSMLEDIIFIDGE